MKKQQIIITLDPKIYRKLAKKSLKPKQYQKLQKCIKKCAYSVNLHFSKDSWDLDYYHYFSEAISDYFGCDVGALLMAEVMNKVDAFVTFKDHSLVFRKKRKRNVRKV